MLRNHPLLPILSATTGICLFSAMDAAMKGASIAAGVFSALVLRNYCGSLMMLPIWLISRARLPSRAALKVHMIRSSVVAVMAVLFFVGVVRLPLAEAIGLSFIAPLIALYLAAVLLGEQIRPRAVIASLLGLAGVAIIASARLEEGTLDARAGWGIAAILGSAVLYAWNLILQRQQAQLAIPQEIAFFQNLFVALILSLAAPWLLVWPAPEALGYIVISAALAVVSLLLLSWAYARAEAQVLVPVEYTGFIWAALFGWLLFGEQVTLATLAGVVLIVIGCWIAARNPTEMTAV